MRPLKSFLDQIYDRYHRAEYLYSDPLEFVHRWSDPLDQECVGLISAMLAYGNVKQIRASAEKALFLLTCGGEISPSHAVRGLKPSDRHRWDGWVHRFNAGDDLWVLFTLLQESWRSHDSLGKHFVRHMPPQSPTIEGALNGLLRDWRGRAKELNARDSFAFFLSAPENGSCCKRWCMYLRWMVRTDALDVGIWSRQGVLDPSHLVMPLDTHTWRLSNRLGLVKRKSPDWKAALEVTTNMKMLDPSDPTRYDFALARIGILDLDKELSREPKLNRP